MKSSPLRLKWVNYPAASFEIQEDFDGEESDPIPADIDAEVKYNVDGDHFVFVKLSSRDSTVAPYRFSITAVAGFEFDLDIARQEYKPTTTPALVPMISVNVARIVYAGAREYLAMMTARAPFGSAVLDSALLEPRDVKVVPDPDAVTLLGDVFKASSEELEAFKARVEARRAAREAEKLAGDEASRPKKKKGIAHTKATS